MHTMSPVAYQIQELFYLQKHQKRFTQMNNLSMFIEHTISTPKNKYNIIDIRNIYPRDENG